MKVIFADKEQARNLIGEMDIYTSNLKEFELKAKLQTNENTTVMDYIAHAKDQALGWSEDDDSIHFKQLILEALNDISFHLSENPMPLPEEVNFVLTTGLEEHGAAYTRGNTIFFNLQTHVAVVLFGKNLPRLIAHELVHIATRNNADWKDKLYSTIGFLPCETPSFSNEFQKFQFSNPDAPEINHALQVNYKGIKQNVSPIIYTRKKQYEGGSFFKYIEVGLFLLDGTNEINYELFPEESRIISFDECEEFFQNVGKNTEYLFHAEEILADNISDIYVDRTDFQSPEVVSNILEVLNEESF